MLGRERPPGLRGPSCKHRAQGGVGRPGEKCRGCRGRRRWRHGGGRIRRRQAQDLGLRRQGCGLAGPARVSHLAAAAQHQGPPLARQYDIGIAALIGQGLFTRRCLAKNGGKLLSGRELQPDLLATGKDLQRSDFGIAAQLPVEIKMIRRDTPMRGRCRLAAAEQQRDEHGENTSHPVGPVWQDRAMMAKGSPQR